MATLDSLTRLKDGWNGYAAPAPSDLAIDNARRFCSWALDPSRIAPSAAGGVDLTFKRGDRWVVVELLNGGPASVFYSAGDTAPRSERFHPRDERFATLATVLTNYLLPTDGA